MNTENEVKYAQPLSPRIWEMPNKNTFSKNPQGNEANTLSYTVHVICWDGVEYTREATKDEIDTQRKNGYVKEDGYSGITFDFRSSHGV